MGSVKLLFPHLHFSKDRLVGVFGEGMSFMLGSVLSRDTRTDRGVRRESVTNCRHQQGQEVALSAANPKESQMVGANIRFLIDKRSEAPTNLI